MNRRFKTRSTAPLRLLLEKLRLLLVSTCFLSIICVARGQDLSVIYDFDIGEQGIQSALLELAESTGTSIVFAHNIGDGLRSTSVSGRMTVGDALARVLLDTGLSFEEIESGVVIVRKSTTVNRESSNGSMDGGGARRSDSSDQLEYRADEERDRVFVEEILVAAQKRVENLQSVPIAITVLPSPVLSDANIVTLDQAVHLVSSLTYSGGVEPRNASIRLRGIGTQSFSLAVEPSVSLTVDGIVTGRPGVVAEDIVDIERVEVLRGPQGIFFGKNSSAGAINIVTRGPNEDEFGGYLKLNAAEQNEVSVRGAVSGPTHEQWSFRSSGFYRDWDGISKNKATRERVGGVDSSWGGRGKLQYTGGDLRVLFSLDYAETDSECCVRAGRSILSDDTFLERAGTPIGPENIDVREDADVFSRSRIGGASIELHMPVMADHTITYLGGYRSWWNQANLDNDSTRFNFVTRQGGTTDSWLTTHELRFASVQDRSVSYVAGLYGFQHSADRRFRDSGCLLGELNELDFDFSRGLVAGCSIEEGTLGSGNFFATVENINVALFGHAAWRLAADVELIGGFRLIYETLEFTYERDNPITGNLSGLLPGQFSAVGKTSDARLIGLAGLKYNFIDDVMGYTTLSSGYKGPAYSISQPLDDETLSRGPLQAERSINFEAGLKGQFYRGQLILNGALFHTKIDGLQIQARDPKTQGVTFRNAASVQTQGVEIDFTSRLTRDASLVGGLTLLDARFVSFVDGLCYPEQSASHGCVNDVQNLSGKPFVNAPNTKLTLSGKYDFGLGRWSGSVQATYVWQDDTLFAINQDRNRVQASYGILNAQLGLTSPQQSVEWQFYAKNLTDRFYVTDIIQNVDTVQAQSGYYHTFARDVGRYFGATVQLNF